MNSNKIKIPILLIYAIYMNPIIIGGLSTVCYLLIYGSALAYIGLNFRNIFNQYLRRVNIRFAFPISWMILALVFSYIVPLLHGTADYSYVNVILAIFRKLIILVFLFVVTRKNHDRETVVDYFMLYYALASVLYIGSTVIFTMLPSLRTKWQSILRLSDTTLHILSSYGYTNRFGWAGFAGFRNTIDCTISLIFLIYLFASTNSKIRIKTQVFVILTFICFLGNMFYGRSGVIASVICLLLGLVLYRKLNPKVVISTLAIVGVGIFAITILRSRVTAVEEWYNWISTPFYNLVTTGSFNNYSANRLLNEMIFMPSGDTLLFGDGRYIEAGTGLYYMRTDAGFMRQILFWGVGLTSVMYWCWGRCLFLMKRDMVLKFMLLVMCVLFEIKGEVFYELLPLFLIIAMIDYKTSDNLKREN